MPRRRKAQVRTADQLAEVLHLQPMEDALLAGAEAPDPYNPYGSNSVYLQMIANLSAVAPKHPGLAQVVQTLWLALAEKWTQAPAPVPPPFSHGWAWRHVPVLPAKWHHHTPSDLLDRAARPSNDPSIWKMRMHDLKLRLKGLGVQGTTGNKAIMLANLDYTLSALPSNIPLSVLRWSPGLISAQWRVKYNKKKPGHEARAQELTDRLAEYGLEVRPNCKLCEKYINSLPGGVAPTLDDCVTSIRERAFYIDVTSYAHDCAWKLADENRRCLYSWEVSPLKEEALCGWVKGEKSNGVSRKKALKKAPESLHDEIKELWKTF